MGNHLLTAVSVKLCARLSKVNDMTYMKSSPPPPIMLFSPLLCFSLRKLPGFTAPKEASYASTEWMDDGIAFKRLALFHLYSTHKKNGINQFLSVMATIARFSLT